MGSTWNNTFKLFSNNISIPQTCSNSVDVVPNEKCFEDVKNCMSTVCVKDDGIIKSIDELLDEYMDIWLDEYVDK